MKAQLRKDDLVLAFQQAGIDRIGHLLVHSSLSSLGYVDGGADAVIDAILQVLGREGTLIVPTFNYVVQTDQVFDPDTMPSQTGVVTEVLRKRPGAIRSLHPTYSFAALGRDAEEIAQNHWRAEPVGFGSPLDRLARAGGCTLLLGVKHDANSSIHLGEAYAGVPYRDVPYNPAWPRAARLRLASGELIMVDLHGEPGCSTAFGVVELPLREKGCIRDFKIGQTKCQLMKVADVTNTTVELLCRRGDILLCSNAGCNFCPSARRATGEWKASR